MFSQHTLWHICLIQIEHSQYIMLFSIRDGYLILSLKSGVSNFLATRGVVCTVALYLFFSDSYKRWITAHVDISLNCTKQPIRCVSVYRPILRIQTQTYKIVLFDCPTSCHINIMEPRSGDYLCYPYICMLPKQRFSWILPRYFSIPVVKGTYTTIRLYELSWIVQLNVVFISISCDKNILSRIFIANVVWLSSFTKFMDQGSGSSWSEPCTPLCSRKWGMPLTQTLCQ